MSAPKLVYVSQIRTTPAKLWEALTNNEFIRQYWFGSENHSTWKEGDPIEGLSDEGQLEWKGTILKSVPESEVVFSFDHLAEEPPSRVTFKIDPQAAGMVQLTITHDEFQEVSPIRDRVKNGWPKIVEGIKSLLETGTVTQQPSTCKTATA
ncbi:SRPBCC domain-containing protein [Haloferula sp. BvORR071]|uniref:SRPBCC domain-containing protein n=1 Tax=Haloferula sp. BvORR071 TaxID=1396141 RepID=UPI00069873B6|nr:SRPBCC domain-containing protein [Haloferula sp. BvORR071]